MSVLFIFLWMAVAIITCGILIHMDPDECGEEFAWMAMVICTCGWPLFAIFGLIYLIFTEIGKLATAVAGFLDFFRKEEEDG